MEKVSNIQKYNIYADAIKVGQDDWDFFHESDKEFHGLPEHDIYLPVFLTRTNEIFEYVQIDKNDKIEKITRQEVNPFFIELSFFDTINKNKIIKGSDLTNNMIDFIRQSRPEVHNATNSEVILWFDQVGVNEFPWNKGADNEVTADDIDKIELNVGHIISKANHFNIDINK